MLFLNHIFTCIADMTVLINPILGGLFYFTYFYGIYSLDSTNRNAFFPGSITYRRVVKSRLNLDQYGDSLQRLAKWANEQSLSIGSHKRSCHWWVGELPVQLQLAVDACSWNSAVKNMFESIFYPTEYSIMEIPRMNELYIAGEDNDQETYSDRVFYLSHIDGPFGWIPFVSVYRCLIGCSDDNTIMTRFVFHNTDTMVQKGDALAFDFNREIHYIKDVGVKGKGKGKEETDENTADSKSSHKNSSKRVVLKTHYCIYPKSMKFFATLVSYLNTLYNQHFRHMFIHTLCPRTVLDYIHSSIVVYSSYTYVSTDLFIGHRNILYLLFVHAIIPNESRFLFYVSPVIYKIVQMFLVKSCSIEGCPFLRDLFLFYVISIIHGSGNIYDELDKLSSDPTISTLDGPRIFR
jgi:hypothetical protein